MTKQELPSLRNCSWWKACIDSILQQKRRSVLQAKPILPLFIFILMLTCSPLLSFAQLIPSKTIQLSLIVQTSQASEKEIDQPKMKKAEEKKMMEMKEKKEYKDEKSIRVLDPSGFNKSQENRVYSGPQPGEKLPPLKVTYLYEENDGKLFDITAETDGRPFILFLQDNNVASIKGMDHNIEMLLKIAQFQKEQTEASDAENPNQGLKIGIVFLIDEANALPDWSEEFLKDLETDYVKVCESPEGREGPGSYGLNRNISQTILIAKDGKVLYNFPFTQPAFYADPHVLGGVAQAMEIEPVTLEKWLNASLMKRDETKKIDKKSLAAEFLKIQKSIKNGKISKEEAAEWLHKLGITWEEGEKLLKKQKDTPKMMEERQDRNPRQIRIANPADFTTSKDKQIFSGPQPGEKLPSLKATSIVGDSDGKMIDFISEVGDQPLVLFLQDGDGVGLRGLFHTSYLIAKITNETEKKLHLRTVFLGDEPEKLKQRVGRVVQTIAHSVYKGSLFGISAHGREGPGRFGLNRNVAQTIIIAKDGKVLYNFTFTKPLLFAEPHVLGAIVQAIGEDPISVEKRLNARAAEDAQRLRNIEGMQREGERERDRDPSPEERIRRDGDKRDSPEARQKEREGERDRDPSPEERIRRDGDKRDSPESRRMNREGQRDRERVSPEALIKRFDKDGDGKLNEAESLAARRAMSNQQDQNREKRRNYEVKSPDEFKKTREETIFSGPQPKEKLPSLKAIAINGDAKGKTIEFNENTNKKPLILILQDEKPLGLRGLVGFTRLIAQISNKSKQQIRLHVVFLGDSPDALAQQANKIVPHVPKNVLLGISPDGREGPGNYGLNRNVAQTILTVKGGKVLHNFALAQPMLSPDPYVLGAVGELIGQKPATLQKWLNERTPESERMQKQSEEKTALGQRLREMVQKGEITAEEARKRYEKAFPSDKEDR